MKKGSHERAGAQGSFASSIYRHVCTSEPGNKIAGHRAESATCSRFSTCTCIRYPTTGTLLHATQPIVNKERLDSWRGVLISSHRADESTSSYLESRKTTSCASSHRERKLQFLPLYTDLWTNSLRTCMCIYALLRSVKGLTSLASNVLRTFARRKAANDGHEILSRL